MIQISCDFCQNKEEPISSLFKTEFKELKVSASAQGGYGGRQRNFYICSVCCERLGFPEKDTRAAPPEEALIAAIQEIIENTVQDSSP